MVLNVASQPGIKKVRRRIPADLLTNNYALSSVSVDCIVTAFRHKGADSRHIVQIFCMKKFNKKAGISPRRRNNNMNDYLPNRMANTWRWYRLISP